MQIPMDPFTLSLFHLSRLESFVEFYFNLSRCAFNWASNDGEILIRQLELKVPSLRISRTTHLRESCLKSPSLFVPTMARDGDAGRTHGASRAHENNGTVRSLRANIIRVLVAATAFCFILSIPILAITTNLDIVHEVPEGHVGTYWRGGALLKTTTDPGFHLKIPLTRYEPIQVAIQTDKVTNIPCGTKGGVMIYFEKIEVVNRLQKEYVYEILINYGLKYDKTWIYDKIHHEINQFCSSHTLQEVYTDMFDQIDEKMKEAIQADCVRYAPGIEIISVRVTKPTIPESIAHNYEQMEEERTKALIAMERQKVLEKEAETQKKIAVTEAKKNSEVSSIIMEQRMMEKESIKKQQEIENEMYLAREKSHADSNYYKVMKEAEANKLKLTPEYLELRFIEAIANNSKMFFGNKVPNMVFDQRLLGNFLAQTVKQRNGELEED